MTNRIHPLLLTALLVPGMAAAQINVGDDLGVTETSIRSALEVQGYTATEFEIEDDEIEVEAMKGDISVEIELSAETGLVLAVYDEGDEDDEDDNDDDDEDGAEEEDDEDGDDD